MSLRNLNRANILRSRELRKAMGASELGLWKALRRKQLGFLFRRQYPVGPYFLDFYCPEASLCIEVDGEQHAERKSADLTRDRFLQERGIQTIRIKSLELFDEEFRPATYWLDVITETCKARSVRRPYKPGNLHP